ncbi:MAG: hypothetical protein GW903_01025 [Alphaproteobacteria bacterium]|nr:hypothetical protein [Alphaproteobacteria bacterium]NCQ87552.1 hypothetical protein [Alphaproteobacteria bacterium]NCT06420.1 hypothetical protein [Alphaproteobacteria bacterium]
MSNIDRPTFEKVEGLADRLAKVAEVKTQESGAAAKTGVLSLLRANRPTRS